MSFWIKQIHEIKNNENEHEYQESSLVCLDIYLIPLCDYVVVCTRLIASLKLVPCMVSVMVPDSDSTLHIRMLTDQALIIGEVCCTCVHQQSGPCPSISGVASGSDPSRPCAPGKVVAGSLGVGASQKRGSTSLHSPETP